MLQYNRTPKIFLKKWNVNQFRISKRQTGTKFDSGKTDTIKRQQTVTSKNQYTNHCISVQGCDFLITCVCGNYICIQSPSDNTFIAFLCYVCCTLVSISKYVALWFVLPSYAIKYSHCVYVLMWCWKEVNRSWKSPCNFCICCVPM
jgi:hypothetical protein